MADPRRKISLPPAYRPTPGRAVVPSPYRPTCPAAQRTIARTPVLPRAAGVIQRSAMETTETKRPLRATTAAKSQETKAKSFSSTAPITRDRRESASYMNVEAYSEYKDVGQSDAVLKSVREKRIWDGFRASVGWSSRFAETFWRDYSGPSTRLHSGEQQWKCAHGYLQCTQPDFASDHSNLEIGHKHGFYTQIADSVETSVVCDGTTHWFVMFRKAVVEANEDIDNLEPQCKKCNRDPRQKKKDDKGAGKYKPEKHEDCPGDFCDVDEL